MKCPHNGSDCVLRIECTYCVAPAMLASSPFQDLSANPLELQNDCRQDESPVDKKAPFLRLYEQFWYVCSACRIHALRLLSTPTHGESHGKLQERLIDSCIIAAFIGTENDNS